MKRTIIMAFALSTVCMNVQCMDGGERQETIQRYRREQEKQKEKQQPPPYEAPSAFVQSSLASANAPLLDPELGINGGGGAVINPQENAIYTGSFYRAGTTTYGQFWRAHDIPVAERYRSGPQLDEYVKNRQNEQNAQECAKCSRKACSCLCIVGGVAGGITGLVYCCQWLVNYEIDWDYDTSTPPPLVPSYSQSYSYSQNYTYMTQLVTALVNESKKMK